MNEANKWIIFSSRSRARSPLLNIPTNSLSFYRGAREVIIRPTVYDISNNTKGTTLQATPEFRCWTQDLLRSLCPSGVLQHMPQPAHYRNHSMQLSPCEDILRTPWSERSVWLSECNNGDWCMQFHTFLNLDQQKPQLYFGLFCWAPKKTHDYPCLHPRWKNDSMRLAIGYVAQTQPLESEPTVYEILAMFQNRVTKRYGQNQEEKSIQRLETRELMRRPYQRYIRVGSSGVPARAIELCLPS